MMKPIEGDITDDAYNRINKMLGKHSETQETVDVARKLGGTLHMTTQERVELYNDIVGMLRDDEKPQVVAQRIVAALNDHIDGRITRIKEALDPEKTPIFRRVG